MTVSIENIVATNSLLVIGGAKRDLQSMQYQLIESKGYKEVKEAMIKYVFIMTDDQSYKLNRATSKVEVLLICTDLLSLLQDAYSTARINNAIERTKRDYESKLKAIIA